MACHCQSRAVTYCLDFLSYFTSGHTSTCQGMLQAGSLSLLTAVDRLGNTPAQCAANSGHRMLASYLRVQEARLKSKAAPKSRLWRAIVGLQFAPFIWAATIASFLVFHWKVVHARGLAPPLPWMSNAAMVNMLLVGWGLLLMAVLNVSDPGYVPTRGSRSRSKSGGEKQTLKTLSGIENLDCPALWAGRWEQLCVTCKIVRPLRAKHEEHAGRCIEVR